MSADLAVGLLMAALGVILAAWHIAYRVLGWVDHIAQERVDAWIAEVLAEPGMREAFGADGAFSTLPAGRGEPTPLHDRLVCEQYEREFDQEAS